MMDMFWEQVVAGLVTGGIYASVALALVMIYQSTHHVNFAQGEMAMFSTYIAWSMINAGVPYWLAFAATVLISFAGGAFIERVIIRPVENAPVLSVVVVFIGLLVIFNSVAGWLYTYTIKSFPSPFRSGSLFDTHHVSPHGLGAIGVTLVMLALLYAFFRFTPLGLAMRAAAQNPASARLVGIRVGRMLALGWGLAAAIGAVAGMMVAPIVYLDPNMMSGVLLYAFAGALLGGIDSPGGAVLGGFIVGVLENLVGAFVVGNDLKLALALLLIVGVLIVKPAGLFGRILVKRV
jgi:branched-chain amino acid transport system permease protein